MIIHAEKREKDRERERERERQTDRDIENRSYSKTGRDDEADRQADGSDSIKQASTFCPFVFSTRRAELEQSGTIYGAILFAGKHSRRCHCEVEGGGEL